MIMKASGKDIRRTIFRNKKRFCSILIITALGVMMLSGLKAACDDLRYSADQFYDAQQVFDIQIVSTMGLDEDDLAALRKADGIERAEGVYRETVYTSVKGSSQNTDVHTFLHSKCFIDIEVYEFTGTDTGRTVEYTLSPEGEAA